MWVFFLRSVDSVTSEGLSKLTPVFRTVRWPAVNSNSNLHSK